MFEGHGTDRFLQIKAERAGDFAWCQFLDDARVHRVECVIPLREERGCFVNEP